MVYGNILKSNIITAEEAVKYTVVKKTFLKVKNLIKRFRNTRAKVRQALIKA